MSEAPEPAGQAIVGAQAPGVEAGAAGRRPGAGRGPRAGRRIAAGLLMAQALAFVAAAIFYIVEGLRGLGDDGTRVVMSLLLFLVLAAGLVVVARGLARGASWARTPALVWNAVLLPISWNLTEADEYGWAALLCALALTGIAGVARRPSD